MYLNFNSIKLHNFFSFEDATLRLSDNGFVMLIGQNENKNDNAKSNGSGKSALVSEAISWCLTGETLRGVKQVKRNGDNDGCWVQLDFDVDGCNYVIQRSKDSKEFKTNLFITKDEVNISGKGIRDTEQILKDILPELTSQLLNSVVVLGQGLPLRFTNNSPSGRKDVLEKLSKSDFMIEDLKNRIESRSSQLNNEIKDLDNKLLVNNTKIQVANDSIKQAQSQLNNLQDPIKYEQEISEINDILSAKKQLIVNLDDEYTNGYIQYNQILDWYNQQRDSLNENLNCLRDSFDEQLNTKQNEYNDLNIKIYALQNQITKLDSIQDTCPTCGQKLLNVKKIDTSNMKLDLNSKKEDLDKIRDEINLIKEDLTNKQKDLKDKNSQKMNFLYEDCKIQQKNLQDINSKKQQAQFVINEKTNRLNQLNLILSEFSTKKTQLETTISSNNKLIEQLNEDMLYISNNRSQLSNRLDIISKFNTSIKRDFRGFLLQNIIDYIDSKVKEYSIEIFNNNNVQFALDGNNISIKFNDKEYEALSGGEQKKVDLIIQFAIRSMLCKYLNFSSNLLVLDEIFDALDSVGCDNTVNFITNRLRDINSVFIISHRADLDIPYDKEIKVLKNSDGVSSVLLEA